MLAIKTPPAPSKAFKHLIVDPTDGSGEHYAVVRSWSASFQMRANNSGEAIKSNSNKGQRTPVRPTPHDPAHGGTGNSPGGWTVGGLGWNAGDSSPDFGQAARGLGRRVPP